MSLFDRVKAYIGNFFSSKGKKASSGRKVRFKYDCMYNDWMQLSGQYSSQGLESIVIHSVGTENFNLKQERGKAEANACDRGINLVVEVYWDNGSVVYYGLKQRATGCVSQVPAQDCSGGDMLASGPGIDFNGAGVVSHSGVEREYVDPRFSSAKVVRVADDPFK